MKTATKYVSVACNDDGFGPSAFAFYLVRALVEQWRQGHQRGEYNFSLKVWVLNKSAYDFNKEIYRDLPEVCPKPIGAYIRLKKTSGEVSVHETLQAIKEYRDARQSYRENVRQHLEGADVAIDIGVPLFVRAATEFGIKRRITMFDHSWAATLRLVSSKEWEHLYQHNPRPTEDDHRLAEKLALAIEEDERCATEVHLFQRYITPPVFLDHWKHLGFEPRILKGVLGTRQDPGEARICLNNLLCELGQKPVDDDSNLVLISPGGTSVWDELLPKLVEGFRSGDRDYIPVFSIPRAPQELKDTIRSSDRMRYFDFVRNSTQQSIMPAFELVVSRAGGGTVNDALASKTPLVCIEEPQVQVVLIERECISYGIVPDFPETRLAVFKQDPVTCVDTFVKAVRQRPQKEVPSGTEKDLALNILSQMRADHGQ